MYTFYCVRVFTFSPFLVVEKCTACTIIMKAKSIQCFKAIDSARILHERPIYFHSHLDFSSSLYHPGCNYYSIIARVQGGSSNVGTKSEEYSSGRRP
jgi:hypothetical protein